LQVGTLKEIVSAVEREKMLDFEDKLQEQIIKTNSYHDTKGLHYYYYYYFFFGKDTKGLHKCRVS
jgi:hypothetical protein